MHARFIPFALAVGSLWSREIIRFVRQRSRIIGALGTPVVFWFIIGSGVGRSFQSPSLPATVGHLQYGFPGTLALILLFTAIFSMISVIDDRNAGFLQGVLVAPVGRTAIAIGKILGSATLAVAQASLFLLLAPATGLPASLVSMAGCVLVSVILALGLSGLGFLLAWSFDSTQGFHAVMNLFLIPMWLLSGALFPVEGAASWMQWIMSANPLTYGVAALRHVLHGAPGTVRVPGPSFSLSLVLTIGFAALTIALSMHAATRRNA